METATATQEQATQEQGEPGEQSTVGTTGALDLAALALGANALNNTQVLAISLDFTAQWMAIMGEFIERNLKPGIDFGIYEGEAKGSGNKFLTKPALWKPGMEKLTIALRLRPRFRRDRATYEMAGSPPGLICYLCQLVDPNGEVMGEGRGAATEKEKGSINNAIKAAEKRAQMDGLLRIAGIAAFFQDEDAAAQEQAANANRHAQQNRASGASRQAQPSGGSTAQNGAHRAQEQPRPGAENQTKLDTYQYTWAAFVAKYPNASEPELIGLISEWLGGNVRNGCHFRNATQQDWDAAAAKISAIKQSRRAAQGEPATRRQSSAAADVLA
jgi:hypothetical protein